MSCRVCGKALGDDPLYWFSVHVGAAGERLCGVCLWWYRAICYSRFR